ncbi:MAG: HNH endonuclease [Patescibacteria group bacterium]|nr:HNH endonuclease [Patescibacteria group bacterium]
MLAEQALPQKAIKSFWKHVDQTTNPNGCWIWTASKQPYGYGQIGVGHPINLTFRAHRVSWIIHHGPIPLGMDVLHDCPGGDNPSCVNPEHLWLGNDILNHNDKVKKGRQPHGESVCTCKITVTDMKEIRRIFAECNGRYGTQAMLCRQFHLSAAQINRIVHHKRWRMD